MIFCVSFIPKQTNCSTWKKISNILIKKLEQLFPPEQDKYAPRYVDKLVRVFTKQGTEEWILIHVEVQSYKDHDFAKRMFQYYYRILDQYDKPITAFAIFADTTPGFHPKYYEREFLGTKVYYAYNTYKITDQDDETLKSSNNPFAMAVLSAKLALARPALGDQQLFDNAYDLAKRLLSKKMSKDKISKVMTFLKYYIHFENPEMMTKFGQQISILTGGSTTMGIEEFLLDNAKKEGKLEGKFEEAITIARELKKEGLAIDFIAKTTKLSIEEIEKL